MKRILSVLLASLVILSLSVVAFVVPASALDGDWDASRSGNDYDEDADQHAPEPGYHYDPELGFVLDSPDFQKNPFVQAHTKNPVNLKTNNDGQGNSVSLKFTVLDYAYANGENIDQWICITLNSQPMSAPGSVEYGEGFCMLIRRNLNGVDLGEGRAQYETFYVDKDGKNFALITGNGFGLVQGDVPLNDDGQEEYTFTVSYDDGYYFDINGVQFGNDEHLNQLLDEACPDGAYVSVLMQTGVAGSEASFAITEWQGELPIGDDSKEPEEDTRAFAPIADSANVPANEPAVMWSSACRDHRKVEMSGAILEVLDNGSVKAVTETVSPYISFSPRSSISYEAADFPYVAVLTRNCWANAGNCYYMSGEDHLSASEEFKETWSTDDYTYADGWALGLIDLSYFCDDDPEYHAGWEGRINGVRVGFDFNAEDVGDEEFGTFEVGFIGMFRSEEEALAYTDTFLTNLGVDPDATETEPEEEPTTEADTAAGTEADTEAGSEAGTEETTTEAPAGSEEVTTEAPAGSEETTTAPAGSEEATTKAPAGSEEATTEAEAEGGCKAIAAAPIVALVAILGVAFVAKKKD